MSIVLIENRGKELGYVNQVLASMNIPITTDDDGKNVAVLKDLDTGKIICIVGFYSDAGVNYHEGNITEYHEILYMEDFTCLSTNQKYIDAIKSMVSCWLLNYLIRSAVSSSLPLGLSTTVNYFQVGINVHKDKNNLLRDSFELISDTLYTVTNSLGFSKV